MERMVFFVCCGFILLDIVSGTIAAIKNRELSSSVMHEGIYNKVGELILLVTSLFVKSILDIEPFTQLGIPSDIAYSIAVYLSLMEIISILENVCKLNPSLPIAKVLAIFDIEVDESHDDDVESPQGGGAE